MRVFINIFLAFLARTLFTFLALPGFIISVFLAKNKSKYFLNIAISYDQLGAVVFGPIMNRIFIKHWGLKFGDPDLTISYVLGANERIMALKPLGKLVVKVLNKIDPGHTKKAKS